MRQTLIGQFVATRNMMSAKNPGIQRWNHNIPIRLIALSIALSLLGLYPSILAHSQGKESRV